MKIINVLKDDSFDEILELFRKAPEGEVFLVLPRNGKLFRKEDHFVAFASEASQAKKTVSLLTSNADTATLARKFGFTVVVSGSKNKKDLGVLISTAPPRVDPDIRDENDDAFSDVPMTSDATMGNNSIDTDTGDADALGGMHVIDDTGKPVPSDEVVAEDAVATLAALASTMDGVRGGTPQRTLSPKARVERPAPVPIQTASDKELDYMDAVWRDKVGKSKESAFSLAPRLPGIISSSLSKTARLARFTFMPKRIVIGILVVACAVFGLVIYSTSGSAEVIIAPMSTPINTQVTIQASDTFTSIDDTFLKLPGQLIEITKTGTSTATASGQRDVASKARGKITVSNAYSSTPQSLVATTRFQAPGGQVFRTLQNVTVPGSTVKAGATVPGTAVIDVVADKPGTDYNIPAGEFVIMAFVEKGDTTKAQQFKGASTQPMSGGASGPSSTVTQADFDAARISAINAAKKQISDAIATQGSTLMVLEGVAPVLKEPQSSAQVDDAADAVTASVTGSLKTVAFRPTDLQDLIRRNILKKDRLDIIPDKVEISYSAISFNEDLGVLTFTASVKGTAFTPVDTEAIRRDIQGMDNQHIGDYFIDRPGVQSARVELRPFWVRSAPKNPEKINVVFDYEVGLPESR